jgi:hypothetical protein
MTEKKWRLSVRRVFSRPFCQEFSATDRSSEDHEATAPRWTVLILSTLAAIGAGDVQRHLGAGMVEWEDRFEIQLARRLRSIDLDRVDPGFSYRERPKRAEAGASCAASRERCG